MSGQAGADGGPLSRVRRMLFRRNELRRRSDRIERAIVVALAAAFLAAAVAAVFLAGQFYQFQRAAAARLIPTIAVLTHTGPDSGSAFDIPTGARATWRLPDGTERSGVLTTLTAPALYYAPEAPSVRVWLDRSGEPVTPPPGRLEMVLNAVFADMSGTAGAAVVFILCYLGCRTALNRRRLAGWESAWATVGPRWTSR